jgi:hypothetical protein
MHEPEVGAEEFSDEDRRYSGSRFHDVVDALFANPYQACGASTARLRCPSSV